MRRALKPGQGRSKYHWPSDQVEACEKGLGAIDFNDTVILDTISLVHNGCSLSVGGFFLEI